MQRTARSGARRVTSLRARLCRCASCSLHCAVSAPSRCSRSTTRGCPRACMWLPKRLRRGLAGGVTGCTDQASVASYQANSSGACTLPQQEHDQQHCFMMEPRLRTVMHCQQDCCARVSWLKQPCLGAHSRLPIALQPCVGALPGAAMGRRKARLVRGRHTIGAVAGPVGVAPAADAGAAAAAAAAVVWHRLRLHSNCHGRCRVIARRLLAASCSGHQRRH